MVFCVFEFKIVCSSFLARGGGGAVKSTVLTIIIKNIYTVVLFKSLVYVFFSNLNVNIKI